MSDFFTRQEETLLKHINDTIEEKVEHMVINRQMPNDDVHWHRGYIAAHKDLAVYTTKTLRKKMNED